MVHVLLVEDNPTDVFMTREGMRNSEIPADVVIAYDGEEALELIGTTRTDLVILDLNVPKFDGYTILQRYRVDGGPPVVVFTGSLDPTDEARVLALGAKEYVVKPRTYEEFLRAVQGILQRWTSKPVGAAVTATAS
jgi:DNA-binding response OmpR family regulator